MKSLRFLMSAALLVISAAAFAQSDAQKSTASKPQPQKTESQLTFEKLKALAGTWEGPVTTDMSEAMKAQMGADMKPLQVTMRVTSRGNVLVHEMQESGTPLDATRYDHPVTMVFLDSDQLNLIHYCDAGNRPRMIGKVSPDGKTVEFEFVDISGSSKFGHMHHAKFTVVDADHHIEEWTFMVGETPIHARFDLKRAKEPVLASR
ncbi:MAG: hypothetical protein HYX26_06080 [Acidobacteriales bacterium]|nr:hypothetical protein [Terriglobales bacterium]